MWKGPLRAEDVLHDVGRRLAEVRAERDLTQEQLAAQAEVSWKYLQQVESGEENLTLRSLVKFANLLQVPLTEFLVEPRERKVRPGRPPGRKRPDVTSERPAPKTRTKRAKTK